MSTKNLVIAILWAVAAGLLLLVGFDIAHSTKYDLVAVGLGLGWLGMLVQLVWANP